MNRIFSPHLLGACSVLLAASLSAWSAPVRLNGSFFTTIVSRGVWGTNGLNLESRTNESSAPIVDSLVSQAAWLNSQAETDFLRISAYAASDYPLHDTAAASAKAVVNFSPTSTDVVPIFIDVTGRGHWYYSLGSISLFDVTAGAMMWNFDWDGPSGTLPWVDHGNEEPRGTASLTMNTALQAAHDYRLTLFSWVSSQEPSSPHIQMQVGGIRVVPEPSPLTLLSLAGLALVAARFRRQ